MSFLNSKNITITSLGILFLFSGFAGLIYESIWTDYIKLFIGHAAYAQSFVLVIYMGGMAVGAWIVSIIGKRLKHCLFWYAVEELLLGISALFFHDVFVRYQEISFTSVLPLLKDPVFITMYRLLTGSMLILPQSILLGATFPLMSSGLLRKYNGNSGYILSLLYFVNSLGAAVGVLFSGFYLIEKFGLQGAIQCAGMIDIVIATGAILIAYTGKSASDNQDKVVNEGAMTGLSTNAKVMLYSVCFFTAVSSFMYEIGWIRMLSLVLGSSSHSFELMLSAFILGLAIGGYVIRKKVDKLSDSMEALALVQVVMGILAIATLFFYGHLFYIMKFILASLSKSYQGYVLFKVSSHLICLVVMLPATICAGMTLPLLTHFLYKNSADDSVIGKVYAFNTIGSIVGVIISVHVIMIIAGVKGLLITGGVIDMLAGIALLWYFQRRELSRVITLSIVTITVSISSIAFLKLDPALLSSGVFRFGTIDKDREIIFYRDGKTSTVSVHEESGSYYLSNNGKVDATTGSDTSSSEPDEATQVLLAAYPLAYASDIKQVAMIGLGCGMTGAVVLRDSGVQSLEIIEIEPFIKDAARLMGPKVQSVFTDNRCRIITDDAKAYFSGNAKMYDIIISEPSNPWVSGVSGLFSQEFFHVIKKYLDEDGLFVQWLHTYEMSTDLLASIFKALGAEFKDYKVFYTASDLIILASKSTIGNAPRNDLFKNNELTRDLRLIGFNDIHEMTLGYAGGKATLGHLFNSFSIRANSDYFPILDQKSEMARFLEVRADAFTEMGNSIIPVVKILESHTHAISQQLVNRSDIHESPIKNIQMVCNARKIHEYVNKTNTAMRPPSDPYEDQAIASMVDKIRIHAQGNVSSLQEQVPEYLHKLLEKTMPWLSVEEMDGIWTFAENMLNDAGAHDGKNAIFTFLKIINQKRFAEAKELGKKLLGNKSIGSSVNTRMILTGTLLSMIIENDSEGIRDIRKRVNWNFSYDLNLRLLFQMAGVYYRKDL